jgi:TonB family protein
MNGTWMFAVLLGFLLSCFSFARDGNGAPPIPIEASPPAYPDRLLKSVAHGTVVCHFWVTNEGRVSTAIVTELPVRRFKTPTLDAVKRWRFVPTVENDAPIDVACRVRVGIHGAKAAIGRISRIEDEEVPPRMLIGSRPEFPRSMKRAGVSGKVLVHVFVDENGDVIEAGIAKSTHADFEDPALRAVRQWRFRPATTNGKPVLSWAAVPVEFDLAELASRGDMRAIPSMAWVKRTFPVVHPYQHAVAGVNGLATVRIIVKPDGSVSRTIILGSSEPEFGMALAAAVEAWTYAPGRIGNKNISSMVIREVVFKPGAARSAIDKNTATVALLIREGRFTPAKATELDVEMEPNVTVVPVYPTGLLDRMVKGTATIEVIVDVKGRAVLPRIVAASEPEFGWAAATAAQRWRFQPPKVRGKPVEVKVTIPFNFTPLDPEGGEPAS